MPAYSWPGMLEAEEKSLHVVRGMLRSLCLASCDAMSWQSRTYFLPGTLVWPICLKKDWTTYLNQPSKTRWRISPGQAPKIPRSECAPNLTLSNALTSMCWDFCFRMSKLFARTSRLIAPGFLFANWRPFDQPHFFVGHSQARHNWDTPPVRDL